MSAPYQAFELAFEERDGYLYARITSKAITLERSEEYLSEVMRRCRELDCTRLMIERHIPQTLSNVEAYRLVTALRAAPGKRHSGQGEASGGDRK